MSSSDFFFFFRVSVAFDHLSGTLANSVTMQHTCPKNVWDKLGPVNCWWVWMCLCVLANVNNCSCSDKLFIWLFSDNCLVGWWRAPVVGEGKCRKWIYKLPVIITRTLEKFVSQTGKTAGYNPSSNNSWCQTQLIAPALTCTLLSLCCH